MPELIRGTCAHCEAEDSILKYARHTMCSKYACQAATHLLVIARRSKAQSEERNPKAAPTYCYKIHSIHGQRDVDPGQLTAKKRRNAIDDADYEDAYLVHGDFGEDADDDGYKDTRWVLLSDILNLSERDLKEVVVTYEKTLNKRQGSKRRALEVASDEE